MKDNIIFCYSGTGNCLDIAKNLAGKLGNCDIVMMRKYPAITDVREAKRVGFVFPCYGGGLPGHVERYLHDIKVSPNSYTFGVLSCSAYKGEGLSRLNDIIPLNYWSVITHHDSCIWLLPHDLMMPRLDIEAAQKRSEELAAKVAEDVLAGVKTTKKLGRATAFAIEHSQWPKIARKKGLQLKANDKCVMCGQCAKLCPTENIRYQGNAVVFSDKCIQCLGCLQYCPQEAITLGAITEKREHYHNPNITVDDLIQDIISF